MAPKATATASTKKKSSPPRGKSAPVGSVRPRTSGRTIPFEIMDTTLRDGEQTHGVSMLAEEKMAIARALLEKVRVDRIEVASARVSEGELQTVRHICDWAAKGSLLDRVEILGFVDQKLSVDWARAAGCGVINLLTKGSLKHCEMQLRKTPEQHWADIESSVKYGQRHGIQFNVYLEDWSGGMLNSRDYVREMIARLIPMGFRRIMLPDTLGLLEPQHVHEFVGEFAERHPETHFDFHAHNDYGLATANSLAGLRAGARGVHATINGLGERAGNGALEEIVVAARDFTPYRCRVDEKKLAEISYITQVFTGKRIAWNKPVTGENVFTQTAGIHADGDKKGRLYYSKLTPARFGRDRVYAMGKLMGKASLDYNLRQMNIELTEDQKKVVLKRIVQLADAKKVVSGEDLPYIIADILQTPGSQQFEVVDFMISTNRGLQPVASVLVRWGDREYQAVAHGDGGYDAFVKALRSLEKVMGFKIPRLLDYTVHIPPGGRSDALVETTITWEGGLKTRGVNPDQLVAAIEATTNLINLLALKKSGRKGRRG